MKKRLNQKSNNVCVRHHTVKEEGFIMTVVELNRYLENKYATSRDIDTLMRYVISETLPPIEDFENAIKIIRNNYKVNINSTLLIIGSYLLSGWSSEKNEMLNTLNEMYLFFSEKEMLTILDFTTEIINEVINIRCI